MPVKDLTFRLFGEDKTASMSLARLSSNAGKTGGLFDKAFGKTNDTAKRLGGAVAGYFAFDAIKDYASEAISQASDLNETISASQQIFGKSAASIAKWGDTAATRMGLSKQAAIEAATGFGNMFQQIGFTNDAATKNSKAIVQMAADFGSFNNLPTTDVLDMISGAMRGEYDSLQRVIPNISAARVEQEALNATHKKSAEDLTAQEKAQATLNIIQRDGAKMMGDFGRTSGGYANQQKIAAAQTANLTAKIGQNLLPVALSFTGFLNGTLLPAVAGLANWLSKNQWVIPPLVAVIGVLTLAFVGVTVATWAMNTALLANPITWIIIGVVALIAAIVLLIMNWDAVVKFISGVWAAQITWLRGTLLAFGQFWVGVWNAVVGFFVGVWNTLVAFGVAVVTTYIGRTRALWSGIIGWLRGLLSGWLGFWRSVWSNVVSFVAGIPGRIRGFFAGIGGWLRDSGKALINGFIGGIRSMIGRAGAAAKSIVDTVARFFPHSPALEGPFSGRGWTLYSGRSLGQGFAAGMRASHGEVRAAAGELMGAASGTGQVLYGAAGGGASRGAAGSGVVVQVNLTGAYAGDKTQLAKTVVDAIGYAVKTGAIPAGAVA